MTTEKLSDSLSRRKPAGDLVGDRGVAQLI
jgi:hypothetical protein